MTVDQGEANLSSYITQTKFISKEIKTQIGDLNYSLLNGFLTLSEAEESKNSQQARNAVYCF